MTKLTAIKKIIGEPLKKEGFVYAGLEEGEGWRFKRELKGVTQWLMIDKVGNFKELEISAGVTWEGGEGIERSYGIWSFNEDKRQDDGRAAYFNGETFERALRRLLQVAYDYFLPGLAEVSQDKYRIKWRFTPEVYIRFHDEKERLKEELSRRYDTAGMTDSKLLTLMARVTEDCMGKEIGEAEETLMGLAALFGDYFVENLEECWWDWKRMLNHEIDEEHLYYVHYVRRHERRYGSRVVEMERGSMHPLWIINDIWQENRMELITRWYNAMFIRRRKHRKALSLWDGKKETEMKREGRTSKLTATRQMLLPFMEQYGFRYDFYQDREQGYLCYRGEGEGRQEIWMMDSGSEREMWIKAVTKSGRVLEIQDIREGLGPYERAEFCLGEIVSPNGQYARTVNKLKEQIANVWVPVLEDEEAYLLQWELTSEMVKKEFFDKERLLSKLDEAYGTAGMAKEELPGFIKRVLGENEGKTLDEFEDTLLGLGVLLGEAAIKETEGSHWTWDEKRSACLVTYRNEVTGIDPAFTLNYAWQRKKPGNVDILCRDLFEGNYIEDRERGGYDIRNA